MHLPDGPAILLFSLPANSQRVLQEAILPSISVCCLGQISLPILDVLRAAQWLLHKEVHMPGWEYVRQSGLIAASNMSYLKARLGRVNSKITQFSTLLKLVETFEVSEPLGFIYGLSGLYATCRRLTQLPILLEPDYSLPTSTVMTRATTHTIQEAHSLDILETVSHRDNDLQNFPGLSILGTKMA